MQKAALTPFERAELKPIWIAVPDAEDRWMKFADLLTYKAILELVGDRIIVLDSGHLGSKHLLQARAERATAGVSEKDSGRRLSSAYL